MIYYASGGGLARVGPFGTLAEAWRSIRLTDTERARGRSPYPVDAIVWAEDLPTQAPIHEDRQVLGQV